LIPAGVALGNKSRKRTQYLAKEPIKEAAKELIVFKMRNRRNISSLRVLRKEPFP
jgi:hypothetical protein